MINKLNQWLRSAKTSEVRELAALADTSASYLSQLANNHRVAQPDLAGRIAKAAGDIRYRNVENMRRLPDLNRGDISPVCGSCRFYKKGCRSEHRN